MGCSADVPLSFSLPPPTPSYSYSPQDVKTKKRYGRLQKALGDHSLLAGSPQDAMEHFVVAADLSRVVGDWVFQAAALEGQASAKVGGCWLGGRARWEGRRRAVQVGEDMPRDGRMPLSHWFPVPAAS